MPLGGAVAWLRPVIPSAGNLIFKGVWQGERSPPGLTLVQCDVWGRGVRGHRAFPVHLKLCQAGDLPEPELGLGAWQDTQSLPLSCP